MYSFLFLFSIWFTAVEIVLTVLFFCGPVVILSCERSGSFRPAQHSRCANDGRESADNEHPDGFIRGRAGKESGNVRTEGVGGVESDNEQHNSADEEYERNDFVHNNFELIS